jgi:hypothetical protein
MLRPLLLACLATALAAEALPAPVAVPDAQAFAVIVVPDLVATLGRCERIANLFAPGQVKPGQLAAALGGQFGDPGLAKLGKGPVVIAIGPGGMAPSAAIILPSSDPAVHAGALRQAKLQVEVVDALVVAGKGPADLALGKRIAAGYAALAAAAVDGDLRFLVAPARLVAAYRPVLAGFTQVMAGQLAKQPNGATTAALVGLEIQGLLLASDDLETVQCDVRLTDLGITQRTLLAAKAGSRLAGALVAPPPAGATSAAARLGLEPGYMVSTGRYDMKAVNGWFADLLTELRQKPEGKDAITDEMIATVHAFGEAATGDFAMRMRAVDGNPMTMECAFASRPGTDLAAIYGRLMTCLFGDSVIGRMYTAMGMTAEVQKDVRTSAGATVGRVHYTLDATKMKAAEAQQMSAMVRDVEFASVPGFSVIANRPADLDRLIAGNAGVLPTTAAHVIGPGRDGYIDMDYVGLARAFILSGPLKDLPMAGAIAKVPPGEPTTAAWRTENGRLQIEASIPLVPLANLVAAMRPAGANAAPPPSEQPVF